MKIWWEDFDQLSLEEHDKVLKNLGLDDEDIEKFNEDFKDENNGVDEEENPVETKDEKTSEKNPRRNKPIFSPGYFCKMEQVL